MIKREKKLFTINNYITKEEFIPCFKHFPIIFVKVFLQHCLLVLIFFLIIGVFYYWSLYETLFSFIVVCLLGFIIDLLRYKSIANAYYNHCRQIGIFDSNSSLIFYPSYLVQKGHSIHIYLEYNKIDKIVENSDFFYLDNSISTIIVPKKNCSKEIITFIHNLTVNKYVDKSKND